ncbi:MAG: YjgP/YjgQ family permease [Phycisphaerales bacterium]|nr:YjgP/YjgQ family permease [Phycisphaerales bacterium]
MIRIIDRYLLRAFFANYLLALFVLISLYVVLDLFVNLDEFTEGSKPILQVITNIGSYYFFQVPLYFSQLSGVITLFAACGTLARLHRNNEVIAVLASGTSVFRLATPLIVAGLAVNGLLVLDQEFLLPSIAPKLARSRDDVEGARVYEIWCVRDGENRLFNARQFSPKEQGVRGLIVLETSEDPRQKGRLRDVIIADRAQWNADRLGWDLQGHSLRMRTDSGGLSEPGKDVALEPEAIRFYPGALSPDDLLLRRQRQWINNLSLTQLDQLQASGEVPVTKVIQVKHGRYTLPIANMIFLLMGMPFFLNRAPERILNQAAKALVTCAVAFVITFIGQQMVGAAETSTLLAALPAWLPIFVFGPIAVVLLDGVKT